MGLFGRRKRYWVKVTTTRGEQGYTSSVVTNDPNHWRIRNSQIEEAKSVNMAILRDRDNPDGVVTTRISYHPGRR